MPEELAAIPEVTERDEEVPRESISMDTWHRYQRDQERYEAELAAYEAKKAAYDEKMEEHAHIDFSALTFVPEVRELSYYIELKKAQKKQDPRFKRTQALLKARANGGAAGGFEKVDNPEADVVSSFGSQRINTGSQAGS